MKNLKRFLSAALALTLVVSMAPGVFATSGRWGGYSRNRDAGQQESTQQGVMGATGAVTTAKVTLAASDETFADASKEVTFTVTYSGAGAWSYAYRVGNGTAVPVTVSSGNSSTFKLVLTDTTRVTITSLTDAEGNTTSPNVSKTVTKTGTTTTYTVSYNANGGGGAVPTDGTKYAPDAAVTVAGQGGVSRDGYTFKGWSLSQSGSVVSSFYIHGNTTLYAQWEQNAPTKHKVTYNANGGNVTGMPDNAEVEAGTAYTPSGTPSRSGYTFKGWSQSAGGSVVTAPVTIGSDTVFYALWEQDIVRYTVSFDADGGDRNSLPADVTLNAGETLDFASLKTPTRTGFTFSGWSTEKNGPVSPGVVVNSHMTLYAVWQPVRSNTLGNILGNPTSDGLGDNTTEPKTEDYIIKFDLNGAAGTAPNDITGTVEEGKTAKVTVDVTAPIRENFTFKGWNTAADGKGTSVVDKAIEVKAGTTTLYAQWEEVETKAEKATVSYYKNGGGPLGGQEFKQEVALDNKGEATVALLGIDDVSWTAPNNKILLGWAESVGATSVKYDVGYRLKIDEAGKKLYAVWGDQTTIAKPTFTANSHEVEKGTNVKFEDLVKNLTPEKSALKVYTTEDGNTALSGKSVKVDATTTYYVEAVHPEDDKVVSERVPVTVTVKENITVDAPKVESDITALVGSTIDLEKYITSSKTNLTFAFYSDAEGKTAVGKSITVANGNTDYYVKAIGGTAESTLVKMTVKSVRTATVTTDNKVEAKAGAPLTLSNLVKDYTDGAVLTYYKSNDAKNYTTVSSSVTAEAGYSYYVVAGPSGTRARTTSDGSSDYILLAEVEGNLIIKFNATEKYVGINDEFDLYTMINPGTLPTNAKIEYKRIRPTTAILSTGKDSVTVDTTYEITVTDTSNGNVSTPQEIKIYAVVKPDFIVSHPEISKGKSVNLSNYVSSVTNGGAVGFYTTEAATQALTSSTVSPITTTTYYAVSKNTTYPHIYTVKAITVKVTNGSGNYTGGSYGPRIPSAGYDLAAEQEKSAYDALYTKILSATSGSTVSHSATTYTKLPFYVVDALAGKNIKLELSYTNSGTKTVTIDCSRIPKTGKNRIWFEAPYFASLYA